MEDKKVESAFVAFTSIERDNWTWNITIREGTDFKVIENMFDFIANTQAEAQKRGYAYKAPVRGGFPPKKDPVYTDYACPECGNKVVKETTKNGKQMEKCSTQRWDRQTNSAVGCKFIKWL